MTIELTDLITGKRTHASNMRAALERADNKRLVAYRVSVETRGGPITLFQVGTSSSTT